jgi:uncharacterized repeat protein (TIGR01451 family)
MSIANTRLRRCIHDMGATVSNAQTTVIRSNPVLAVAISGAPNPVTAGEQLLFRVSYKNTGDADALVTNLVATIPPNTTYVAGSAPGAVYNEVTQTLSWPLGTVGAYPPLAPMDSFTFLVEVASPLADHTALTSGATIAANNAATQTASATVYVASQPLLLASKTVTPQQAKTGQIVTYTIKLQNIGTDTAVNITVSDTLPSAVRLLSADNGGIIDNITNTVSWTVATLEPGDDELVFNADARVIADGLINNTALARRNLVVTLFSLEQYDEALARGQALLNSHPDEFRIHYVVGAILLQQGDTNEAIKHYSEAIQLAPDFKEAQDGLKEAQKTYSK